MKTSALPEDPQQAIRKVKVRSRPIAASLILVGGVILLVFGMALAIAVGAKDIALPDVWNALFHFNPDLTEHQIIRELRMPRVIGAAIVGAAFAVAGAIMQGMTRNPLADTGLLGLNAGASFALALCFSLAPGLSFLGLMLYSFLGAGMGVGIVYGIGSRSKGGLTPIRLVLAGAAVSALFTALSEGVALYFKVGQDLAFWYAGGVAGTQWLQIQIILPAVAVALVCAFALARSITLLSLGDEIATGLGQRTGMIRLFGVLIVLVLAGAAVSVVGSVGFVGLIIPHLTRKLVGVDYRWIIPCSAVLGSLLIVFADLAARMINPPQETPIGALVSLIGVPFFLYLAVKERRSL
ncbi:ferrichrome ABC transporter permease [Saccharibacillus sp. O23]|uniref:FecCD family ABC transporter permease n=1 Tax=Saccharibacillus sp. O23 TaxID=2009338 RepID=UPI000B4DF05E|nr:iron ABC transporter permease [Saccharibacillus sp. O23]OWR28317.1 ferrichrome ABC transporter permease [Saccharibacillus sp. O23]